MTVVTPRLFVQKGDILLIPDPLPPWWQFWRRPTSQRYVVIETEPAVQLRLEGAMPDPKPLLPPAAPNPMLDELNIKDWWL